MKALTLNEFTNTHNRAAIEVLNRTRINSHLTTTLSGLKAKKEKKGTKSLKSPVSLPQQGSSCWKFNYA